MPGPDRIVAGFSEPPRTPAIGKFAEYFLLPETDSIAHLSAICFDRGLCRFHTPDSWSV